MIRLYCMKAQLRAGKTHGWLLCLLPASLQIERSVESIAERLAHERGGIPLPLHKYLRRPTGRGLSEGKKKSRSDRTGAILPAADHTNLLCSTPTTYLCRQKPILEQEPIVSQKSASANFPIRFLVEQQPSIFSSSCDCQSGPRTRPKGDHRARQPSCRFSLSFILPPGVAAPTSSFHHTTHFGIKPLLFCFLLDC
jgi:hypothetical protein